MLGVLETLQHQLPLALDAPSTVSPKKLAQLIGAQPQQAQLATPLEELAQATAGAKQPIQAILDLLHKPLPAQGTDLAVLAGGELGPSR
jgi:hypothetical protein